MYQKFYQDTTDTLSEKFAKEVTTFNKPVSAAQLQGFFMIHKLADLDMLLQNLECIWQPAVGSSTSHKS